MYYTLLKQEISIILKYLMSHSEQEFSFTHGQRAYNMTCAQRADWHLFSTIFERSFFQKCWLKRNAIHIALSFGFTYLLLRLAYLRKSCVMECKDGWTFEQEIEESKSIKMENVRERIEENDSYIFTWAVH